VVSQITTASFLVGEGVPAELAARWDLELVEVTKALLAGGCFNLLSLDQPLDPTGELNTGTRWLAAVSSHQHLAPGSLVEGARPLPAAAVCQSAQLA
jgi:hypothetical protein